ncbi:MAG: polysaccharide pyruvyl transferase family protein [Solobacterium sp.]|nr:polysaccharide pyruvyl transferase family protein [Solobacterium sp.]
MKKIGLVTKIGKNYGAVLQAYALKKLLESAGNPVEVIQYRNPANLATDRIFLTPLRKGVVRYNLRRLRHILPLRKSIDKFIDFRNRYLNMTRLYVDEESLRRNPPEEDIYVVGSDQVWNPGIVFSSANFLDFGREDAGRFSYAASFGKNRLSEEYAPKVKNYLSRFDGISVREESGVEILKELGIAAKFVLDPTLMLSEDQWSEIEQKPKNLPSGKLIVCYFLHLNDAAIAAVKKLKKETGLPAVNISAEVFNPAFCDQERWDLGPREFVWLMHHAEYVVTSSFHGTAFSLLFQKRFLTVSVHKDDGRLVSLLKVAGCEDHLLKEDGDISRIYDKPVIGPGMALMREQSREYLQEILGYDSSRTGDGI